jgi:hypothetical protein
LFLMKFSLTFIPTFFHKMMLFRSTRVVHWPPAFHPLFHFYISHLYF